MLHEARSERLDPLRCILSHCPVLYAQKSRRLELREDLSLIYRHMIAVLRRILAIIRIFRYTRILSTYEEALMRAIVTGATKGIGLAVTKALLAEGAAVFAVGRDMKLLSSLAGSVASGELIPYRADLCDADIPLLVKSANQAMGGVDILINNAGITLSKNLEDTTEDEWDHIMLLNAKVPFLLCRECLGYLREQERSFIINIASVVASKGYESQSAYTASKHALLGFSKSLAKEVHQDGIRVHVISPGGVATDMVSSVRPDIDTAELIAPEEIADIVIFLLTRQGNAAIDEIRVRRDSKTPFV